jgi:hypothetical protein
MDDEVLRALGRSECSQKAKSRLVNWDWMLWPPENHLTQLAFASRTSSGGIYEYYLRNVSGMIHNSFAGVALSATAAKAQDPLLWYCECRILGNSPFIAAEVRDQPGITYLIRDGDEIGRIIDTTPPLKNAKSWRNLLTFWKCHIRTLLVECNHEAFGCLDIQYPVTSTKAYFSLESTNKIRLPVIASKMSGLKTFGRSTHLFHDMVIPSDSHHLTTEQLSVYFMINILFRLHFLRLDFSIA